VAPRARRSTAQLPRVCLRQRRVADERVALAVRLERRVDVREALVDLLGERRLLRLGEIGNGVERGLRALDVRLEVDEVDVRVALLLPGDLRLGHLAQELDRSVGDLSRLELDCLHLALEVEDVRDQLLRERSRPVGRAAHPEHPLDRVEPRPLGCRDVAGSGVDRRVELPEALSHGLDPLVRDARLHVGGLRAPEVTGAQFLDEPAGLGDEQARLRLDVLPVASDRGAGRGRRLRPATRDDERAALGLRAGAVHREAPGLQRQREVAGQPGSEILDLAEDPVAVEDLELRHGIGAVVDDLERHRPGGERQLLRLAALVGQPDVDRATAVTRILLAPAAACGQRERRRDARRGQQRSAGGHAGRPAGSGCRARSRRSRSPDGQRT
jgi:hypothetical protein